MVEDMTVLEREHVEFLPSREALGGLVNVNIVVPVNLAIAVLGSAALACQNAVGIIR
ncbi:hypothetical protein [Gandjariella thermophila]|uniref:Uncharacterized protein n=1 Tax=Gandjariella thermophila TaxID=1931992 RepID=A0A4D4J271_9PSEU|nr:hypothetical protein [Gandjariella thermophila]GDY28719.1 hypothetical protein GTS_03520 [Gandjariella thermophila]